MMKKRVVHALKMAIKENIPTKKDYLELLQLPVRAVHARPPSRRARARGPRQRAGQVGHLQEVPGDREAPPRAGVPRRGAAADRQRHLARRLDAAARRRARDAQARVTSRPACSRPSATRCPASASSPPCSASSSRWATWTAPPEEIGHHVAAALVGTFLGILMCYGVLQPIANNVETQEYPPAALPRRASRRRCRSARGVARRPPSSSARKMIFTDERPELRRSSTRRLPRRWRE